MYKVLIIINAQQVSNQGTILSTSPATQRMTATLKDAIKTETEEETIVKVVPTYQLSSPNHPYDVDDPSWIFCPLTIEFPPQFEFPGAKLFKFCRDVKSSRQWVEEKFRFRTANKIKQVWHGNYWLPIVLTAKGPIYGEVIGEGELPNSYQQPVDFPDEERQPLYRLSYQFLDSLSAQPGVYLLQFGFQDETIIFDRVWPFPAAPALASVGVQEPNLYSCHWQCLIEHPIRDVVIA
jgi:hypothetical protein